MFPRGRPIQRLIALTIFLIFLVVGSRRILWGSSTALPRRLSPGGIPNFEGQVRFWNNLRRLLESNPPGTDAPKRLKKTEDVLFNPNADSSRADLLYIADSDVRRIQKAHEKVVRKINAENSGLDLVYNEGKRGIISSSGKKYFSTLLISLRMLRRTGSNLPMEVFLASKEEYEFSVCRKILPKLNARCIVLSDILGNDAVSHLQSYQLKPFAMLFSSFEELLWLDADCFPLHDPIELLQSKPFTDFGLVTWPDFWASSASPLFYDITSQLAPRLSERASTEGGQLLISKRTHAKTLLLASYYNYYGPTHYYRLLSQGGMGEGDKETYLAAATALHQPFYAVNQPVRSMGHVNANGDMTGYAMVQYSPIEDYRLTSMGLYGLKDADALENTETPRPFFVHPSHPKIDPVDIFNRNDANSPIRGVDGKPSRAWLMERETVESLGRDVEREFWMEVLWAACKLEEVKFKPWKGIEGTCKKALVHLNEAFYGKGSDGG
ncbi:hypothetical protein AJ79_08145 [Helicocarpus griseus UAMH5409]|uniref:Alpha-1,2-mannosyltransferase n=1 Tax=Helicocarpus griseus UAMH5409 TaxID=1447875 RepID=A0A2B7WVL1_9EURO|nr:hypothetical protein AJ79_08145 [Helicocarpus griseus UAMH5409]